MFGKINLAYLALQVRDLARWRLEYKRPNGK